MVARKKNLCKQKMQKCRIAMNWLVFWVWLWMGDKLTCLEGFGAEDPSLQIVIAEKLKIRLIWGNTDVFGTFRCSVIFVILSFCLSFVWSPLSPYMGVPSTTRRDLSGRQKNILWSPIELHYGGGKNTIFDRGDVYCITMRLVDHVIYRLRWNQVAKLLGQCFQKKVRSRIETACRPPWSSHPKVYVHEG